MEKFVYKNETYKPQDLMGNVADIARKAAKEITKVAQSGNIDEQVKSDQSRVTRADHASEAVILPALKALTPNIPILSEEDVEAGNIPDLSDGTFWTVDPLDGTQDFIDNKNGYAVLIGLVHKNRAVMGVIYQPSQSKLYAGSVLDQIAFSHDDKTGVTQDLTATPNSEKQGVIRAVINHGSGDVDKISRFLEKVKDEEPDKSAIKKAFDLNKDDLLSISDRGDNYVFCPIAEGQADVYAHISKTKGDGAPFWDVVPGHALVTASGGKVTDFDGVPLRYKQGKTNDKKAVRTVPYIAFASWQLKQWKKDTTPKKRPNKNPKP